MRYNLDSTLPINAFSPRGGRSPFNHGMTLEGGGGGFIGKALGSVAKGVTDVVKGVVQPVYNATLKNIPGVDNALVNLDKSVGKAIPGGWGTVAAIASSFIPGAALAAMGMTQAGLATGLGALSGSGVMHKGNNFNLQGAIMGGAMAYGASQLTAGLSEAGKSTTDAIAEAGTTNAAAQTPVVDVNAGLSGTTPTPPVSDIAPNLMKAAQSNIDPSVLEGMSANEVANANVLNAPTPQPTGLEALKAAGTGTVSNVADAGTGIKNLVGLGADGSAAAARDAISNAVTQNGAVAGIVGTAGLASLEEQQRALDAQLAAGNIAQSQYDSEKAKIAEEIATANKAVSDNPLHATTDPSTISEGPSLYAKQSGDSTLYDKNPSGGSQLLYAMGGEVQMNPPDDQTGMPNQTPMNNFNQPGLMSMIGNTVPQQNIPQQGMPQQAIQQGMPQQTFAAGGEVQHYFLGGMFGGGGGGNSFGIPIGALQDALAKVGAEKQKAVAEQVVKDNPLQTSAGLGNLSSYTNTPSNTTLYANNPKNDFYDLDRTEKRNTYAAGGQFLSGGGDGMSDSIKANINGSQEARLADGEFVIPADVVSHIGNGSSKAGAKQLYSMMDRVRQARVGTKKQGKQINPRKYLAA